MVLLFEDFWDDNTFSPGIFVFYDTFISVSGPLSISMTAKAELVYIFTIK